MSSKTTEMGFLTRIRWRLQRLTSGVGWRRSQEASVATPTDCAAPNHQQILKLRAKDDFSKHHGTEEGLEIRKLKMRIEKQNKAKKVQLLTLGHKSDKPTKIILLVGATGSGKTTLINAMVNFIYRVEFSDDFRLILIGEKEAPKSSQAESQTALITAYTFYNLPGMPFDYNYVLIDTPGFGDTRGIQQDREMMNQLKNFLKQGYGIDQVDGVGFVTPASAARLTQTQRYVYDGLSSMFAKDIKDNIYIMATFADAKTPPILDALREAELHHAGFYKFNNSALYASNRDMGNESDSNDEDSMSISKLFWEMGCRSMTNFFNKLGKTLPASLTLTKQVLEERNKLQQIVIGLQNHICTGLSKLAVLDQERDMLSRLDNEIRGTYNYTEEVEVPKIEKINLKPKEHVTNCIKCNMTCHYPCLVRDDKDKMKCSAMTEKYCRVCPGKCFWNIHKNMGFRYEHSWKKEQRTVQELLDRYQKARKGKLNKEAAIKAIEKDINQYSRDLLTKIKEAQRCGNKLEEIALKPNPLSTKEYIDLMIESEKMQKRHNFQKRVNMLQKLKEEAAVVQWLKEVAVVQGLKEEVAVVHGLKEEVAVVQGLKEEVAMVQGLKEEVAVVQGLKEEVAAVQGLKEEVAVVQGLKEEVAVVQGLKEEVAVVQGLKEEVAMVQGLKEEVAVVQGLKKEVAVVQGLRDNYDTNSGEDLLKHFHELMVD